jgi:hypothetical protein
MATGIGVADDIAADADMRGAAACASFSLERTAPG